jgi:hypothetical protein
VVAAGSAQLELVLPIERSGWLAVRCRGKTPQRVFAHTSPVVVRVEGSSGWAKPAAVRSLLGELDAMLGWARMRREAQDRERFCHVFEEARSILANKLSL